MIYYTLVLLFNIIMNWNVDKICRVCLEEGSLSSLFSGNFTTLLSEMIQKCTNVKISIDDGLPSGICSNCIYKLGVAYHFKQKCEKSDVRLRECLGLEPNFKYKDVGIMTDRIVANPPPHILRKFKCDGDTKRTVKIKTKPECEKLKRGPKPKAKESHSCYVCRKEFKCKAQLDMHIRTHTGERPFLCMYCNRGFTQKQNLSIHMRLHTGDKPYQCEMCSKRFSAQGNLQTHIKVHKGEKDNVCTICKKGFITSSELNRHMSKHTGIKDHKCNMCNASYVQLRDLRSHKLKKHNISEPRSTLKKNLLNETNPLLKQNIEQRIIPTNNPSILNTDGLINTNYQINHVCTTCGDEFPYIALLARHCALKHSPYGVVNTHNLELT